MGPNEKALIFTCLYFLIGNFLMKYFVESAPDKDWSRFHILVGMLLWPAILILWIVAFISISIKRLKNG